jgi:hypothetical protein
MAVSCYVDFQTQVYDFGAGRPTPAEATALIEKAKTNPAIKSVEFRILPVHTLALLDTVLYGFKSVGSITRPVDGGIELKMRWRKRLYDQVASTEDARLARMNAGLNDLQGDQWIHPWKEWMEE